MSSVVVGSSSTRHACMPLNGLMKNSVTSEIPELNGFINQEKIRQPIVINQTIIN